MTDLEVILMIIHPTTPFYRDKTETQDLISATQMLGVGQMAGKGVKSGNQNTRLYDTAHCLLGNLLLSSEKKTCIALNLSPDCFLERRA
jgi:hypothetical protein